jgi:hypothetical protein
MFRAFIDIYVSTRGGETLVRRYVYYVLARVLHELGDDVVAGARGRGLGVAHDHAAGLAARVEVLALLVVVSAQVGEAANPAP